MNYLYSTLRTEDYRHADLHVQHGSTVDRTTHVSAKSLSVRVPDPLNFLMKGHFIGMFAQDKWNWPNNLTLSLGMRYDFELLPTPNQDNPLFADNRDDYPKDMNNVSPVGFSYALGNEARSALRGGDGGRVTNVVHLPDADVRHAGLFLELVHRAVSDQQRRRRSARRHFPDQRVPGERPHAEPRSDRRALPSGVSRP